MVLDEKKIVTNKTELVAVLNNQYNNIFEKSSDEKPTHVPCHNSIKNKRIAIQKIKNILKIIQVLSKFWKIFRKGIYLRYHIKQLKKFKNCSKKLMSKTSRF